MTLFNIFLLLLSIYMSKCTYVPMYIHISLNMIQTLFIAVLLCFGSVLGFSAILLWLHPLHELELDRRVFFILILPIGYSKKFVIILDILIECIIICLCKKGVYYLKLLLITHLCWIFKTILGMFVC